MFGCSWIEERVDQTVKVLQQPPIRNLIKINPTFLELRDDTAKIAFLYDLEICKNFLVLPVKYVVFLYSVCWKYFHPNKHLAI